MREEKKGPRPDASVDAWQSEEEEGHRGRPPAPAGPQEKKERKKERARRERQKGKDLTLREFFRQLFGTPKQQKYPKTWANTAPTRTKTNTPTEDPKFAPENGPQNAAKRRGSAKINLFSWEKRRT